jgi:putative hydrolase of the HAD superfamily
MAQRCSFCRVPDNQVERIIYGTQFNICSDCIRTCLDVLNGDAVTGWAITTSPQRCDNCDRRPAEGYRHLLNRATYSPRVCERCLRFYIDVLLKEMPSLEEELQNIIRSVFEAPDANSPEDKNTLEQQMLDALQVGEENKEEDETVEEEMDSFMEETLGNPKEKSDDDVETDMMQTMQDELATQTQEKIQDITRQAIEELERRPQRASQTATQTEPAPLATTLSKPLGILFDLGDTLLHHLSFDPEAGTEALLKIAHNPEKHTAESINDRIEAINHDLVPRREQAQIEFHPYIMQRHVYEALNITFNRDHAAVERVFWRNSMKWEHEPGVEDMLQKLQAKDIPIAIVSNAAFGGTTLWWEMEQQGLADYFRFLMSSADYWVRKPHPLLMETAAAKLGFAPQDIWYVGNSAHYDVGGARNAGMGAIWYNRVEDPIDGPEPHAEIRSWEEFIALVEKYLGE